MRAQETGCAAVLAAHARSVEAEYLLRTGWAAEVVAPRDVVRQRISVRHHRRLRPRPRARRRGPLRAAADRGVQRCCARRCRRGRCWCRRLASATPPGSPATAAVRRPCAPPATGRSASADPTVLPSAPGAPPRRPGWTCAECGGRGLRAPVLGDARTAEEIGRALPGVTVRSRPRGSGVLAEVDDTPGRSSWPLPARSRWPAAATPRWCCSTPGSCSARLGPARHRGGRTPLGQRRRAGAVPPPTAVASSRSATPRTRVCRRWCAGTRAGSRAARSRSASRPTCRRPRGSPPSPVSPTTSSRRWPTLQLPAGAEVLGPVPVEWGRDVARRGVRCATSYACRAPPVRRSPPPSVQLQAQRSARKLPHLRVEVDPAQLG